MADKKIITVVGATGAQGGGLVRAILEDPTGGFTARALTRDANSDKAKALRQAGAEVVAADVDDTASVRKAFEGAYGTYCVTFFWDHFSPERELAQAQSLANAAKSAGVKHAVWSTLEDTRHWVPLEDNRMPTLMGKYKVPHFDAKGEADGFFTVAGVPTTMLSTSFYWDNFISFGLGPKKGPDGKLTLALPMGEKKLPGIAAEDIGRCAYGVLKDPSLIGKTVGIAGQHLTGTEMAAGMSKALGVEIGYYPVPFDTFRAFGFPGAEDIGNMFQFKHDFNEMFCGARSVEKSRKLNPALQTFDQWLARNAAKIPLE